LPEGPEIRREALRIAAAVAGVRLERVEYRVPRLAARAKRLERAQVEAVTSHGKAMLIAWSNGLTHFSHNQLYGKWRIVVASRLAALLERRAPSVRVVIATPSHAAVLLSATQIALLTATELARQPYLARLGPDVLDRSTTRASVLRRLSDPAFARRSLASLLLDQTFLAGLGNYLRSDILHRARLRYTRRPVDLAPDQLAMLADSILVLPRHSLRTGGTTNDPVLVATLATQGVTPDASACTRVKGCLATCADGRSGGWTWGAAESTSARAVNRCDRKAGRGSRDSSPRTPNGSAPMIHARRRPSSIPTAGPLGERFAAVRAQTMALAAPLSPEDCAAQSMPDASPVKWHLAHTTWFFETFVLEPHAGDYRSFDPAFRVLFNSYYNAVGAKHPRPERGLLTRPSLDAVLAYRAHVDAALAPLLDADGPWRATIELGLHHEQQHQELVVTDLKHLLSRNPTRPAYLPAWPLTTVAAREPGWFAHPGGIVEVGHAGPAFAFDNEGPRHPVLLQPFELATHPVTNGEYIAFIEDGGYRRPELWLSLGWDAVGTQRWEAPLYWERRDGAWWTFTLRGMAEIDPAAPLTHVSLFEADAYARWAGARLPTEFEWEAVASGAPLQGNFLENGVLHPLALRDASARGQPTQLFGDVWEWTQSSYAPYPRFRAAEGAIGEYNGKFMCNQVVLRGGSCATPRSHIRASYRNFFPPESRWQFSGLRLARDVD
jgi:ergothioneine biosynthesis protein EgtB